MKFLPLVWKNIWRRKFRTIFTLLSIFIAFVLFGILMTIRHSFSFGVEIAGADRLVLIHKVSLIMPLPVSYQGAAAADQGRRARVAPDLVRRHLPGPVEFLREHGSRAGRVPEDLSRVRRCRPNRSRPGATIGRAPSSAAICAERFGWKIGDSVPLTAPIWLPKGRRHHVGVQHRRHLRRRRRRRQDADVLPIRLPRRESRAGPGAGRLVRREDFRSGAGRRSQPHVRRDVRELVRRDEDDDGEGIRRRVREADRRHRQHHDCHLVDGAVHVRPGRGEHHGAVGARAHERARGAEDARLFRRRRS